MVKYNVVLEKIRKVYSWPRRKYTTNNDQCFSSENITWAIDLIDPEIKMIYQAAFLWKRKNCNCCLWLSFFILGILTFCYSYSRNSVTKFQYFNKVVIWKAHIAICLCTVNCRWSLGPFKLISWAKCCGVHRKTVSFQTHL